MRREVGNAVARLRGDLRLMLASWYRDALAQRTWFVGPMLVAAGAFDRLVVLMRLRRTMRDPRTLIADHCVARWRRLRAPRSLALARAGIGGHDTLSLTLVGAPADCAAVSGMRLGETPLDTTVSCGSGAVRLVATVPAAVFTGEPLRVHVLAGPNPVVITATDRTAVAGRFGASFAAQQWPPRFALDADRALIVQGCAPATRSIGHEIAVGITSARVHWTAPTGGTPDLRLIPHDGGRPRVIGGVVDPQGTCQVAVDLRALVESPDAAWDISVSDASGWTPLLLAVGDNPALAGLPDSATIPLRRADGTAARVAVEYTAINQLSLRVGALR